MALVLCPLRTVGGRGFFTPDIHFDLSRRERGQIFKLSSPPFFSQTLSCELSPSCERRTRFSCLYTVLKAQTCYPRYKRSPIFPNTCTSLLSAVKHTTREYTHFLMFSAFPVFFCFPCDRFPKGPPPLSILLTPIVEYLFLIFGSVPPPLQ